jgi:mannitol/fructose-specific phosphotransferase system IIA component (Ntr-type)/predicted transcriptional regulator
MNTVTDLNRDGQIAIFGDASRDVILEEAGILRASHLVITLPHASDRMAIISAARSVNEKIRILVRARYLSEREDLEQAGTTAAVFEEGEAAVALARLVLSETGASRDRVEQSVRDLRLRLILENVSNLSAHAVRTIMVPWTRVRRLSTASSLVEVAKHVAQERFSRWPVVDANSGRPIGYLLAKDLVAETSPSADWKRLIRPLHSVRLDEDIESVLVRLQEEASTVCLVEDDGMPVGLITIEDILEQVIGRMEDEYPRHVRVQLHDALAAGAVVLELCGTTSEEVITELVSAILPHRLPGNVDVAELALNRERELSTDVGLSVAIPHARCARLAAPVLAFGRSSDGVVFDVRSDVPVRLVFLLITPLEHPDLQVLLLGKLARIAESPIARQQLLDAETADDVATIIEHAESAEHT